MARILFLPVFLAILAFAVLLAVRIKSMLVLSKSKDIVLFRPAPYSGEVNKLAEEMLNALKSFKTVEYRSKFIVNFRKITTYSKLGPEGGYSRISGKSSVIEVTGENGNVIIKNGKKEKTISGQNPWINFWCGISSLEENLRLFYESGMKMQAGDTGTHMARKYTEILVLSHAMPPQSGEAFSTCLTHMASVYGKNLAFPEVKIRNFMVRILVNNLTSMPDFIETKYNIFKDSDFICDCFQNSSLLY